MAGPDSSILKKAGGCLRRNDLAAAEKACRDALAAAPDDPAALALMGDICLRSGRASRAVKQYRRAIEAETANGQPASPALLVALSGAQQVNGDARGAMASLNEALQAEPDFVDARFARAGLAWALGDKKQTVAASASG